MHFAGLMLDREQDWRKSSGSESEGLWGGRQGSWRSFRNDRFTGVACSDSLQWTGPCPKTLSNYTLQTTLP